MDNGYCERFKTKLVKEDEVIKETYSDEQLKILLTKPDTNKTSFAIYRNWVIVSYSILYSKQN